MVRCNQLALQNAEGGSKILICWSSSSGARHSLHCLRGIARYVAKVFTVAVEDVESSVQVRYLCLWVGTLHHTPIRDTPPANPLFCSRQINPAKSCTSWPMCAFMCPCPFQYAGGALTAVTRPSVTHYFTCFIFCEIEPLARIAWAAAPAVS